MLDPVPCVRPRVETLGLLEDVQHDVQCGVADGVGGHLPAGTVRADDPPPQFRGGELEKPAVALPRPGVVLVVAAHEGAAADQRAVGQDLGRAQPEPFVAEPRPHAQVQAHAGNRAGASLTDRTGSSPSPCRVVR